MLTGLNHLTLAVRSLEQSLDFYQQLLGMQCHARWATGAYLSCGALWLCLSYDKDAGTRAGHYTHYAFTISPADFPAMVSRLTAAGVHCWKDNRSEGESFYFLDPDNHQLELHVGSLASRLSACREAPITRWSFIRTRKRPTMTIIIRPEKLETLMALYCQMPEFSLRADTTVWEQRLSNRVISPLVAWVDGKPAAFKLGYALDDKVFYSWLGGVLPEYRRSGIAQQLLTHQENWVKQQGYQRIRVKTRNQFRGMLLMLIKNHYQLIDIEKTAATENYRLLLEKQWVSES